MHRLYYRDWRRRVEALEARYFPEPDPVITVVWTHPEDGLPFWVCEVGGANWQRRRGEAIPPEVLAFASPEARAAYEARAAQEDAVRGIDEQGSSLQILSGDGPSDESGGS